MSNLLFVDDDQEILSINTRYFSRKGFVVKTAKNARECFHILKSFHPDCIVLDIMMPELNGFETCKKIRTFSFAPIIFLSGCRKEDDKIRGLTIADDYMIKPYSFRELTARIQVQMRKRMGITSTSTLYFPPITMDVVQHKAYYETDEIPLSNREYELLYLLATHSNETVTFEEIGFSMWNYYSEADRRTIMVTASRLRKKLEDYAGLVDTIETVWSKGYKFISK